MTRCGTCGREIGQNFAFCPYCGAPAAAPEARREQRKRVTILFCDLTGSTALGESIDPEALRALLARYFERMKGIIESHGGTVEKFIGDAVMAVFGVPQVHEDDALRAVRAATEMRAALPELGVQARIGVNSGEVVTGTSERLATGDPVNVAARLEGAAAPGEVLLGEETCRLVGAAAEIEPLTPLALKGKSEPVPAYRLVAVRPPAERPFATPMIGRERELRRLQDAYAQAVHDRSCQLFTVLGTAGVGKSRLAAEFLSGVASARVARGRCLPYGEGITYWPVIEVLKHLDMLPSDDLAASALRSLLGESQLTASAEEIAWGFRKLLEETAQDEPLVVVLDDLQWGEETFLDLVEHVADLARDAPLLLLCMARPELLERRPGWGGGKWNATTVLLEPLDGGETDRLLDALGGAEEGLRERIRPAAEGNPLFLEEMVAMVRASGGEEVIVPPTIHALLAARLDQLDPAEREVLQCGSVEGRVFHRSAITALLKGETNLSARLVALVRKELLRPARAQIARDEAYRFRHLLIRDAAYDALPKAVRADLHERFTLWLEERGADLLELDEIVGYHLEQAAQYRRELGQPDGALAERAGDRLAAAGRKASWRGDTRAAKALLERALTLLRPIRLDVDLELDAVDLEEDMRKAAALSHAVADRARSAGDHRGEAVARVVAVERLATANGVYNHVETTARAALPLLKGTEDHVGLVRVWAALGGVANYFFHWEDATLGAEQAIAHAHRAGRPTLTVWRLPASAAAFGLVLALAYGPRPADEALHTLDTLIPDNGHPGARLSRVVLLAMLRRFDDAEVIAREASARLQDLGGEYRGEDLLADMATVMGDHERAAGYLRLMCDRVEERGALGVLSTYAPLLGRSLCMLGRYHEAEPLAQRGRELGDESDVATQHWWRQVLALVQAHRGEYDEAERLAREAVAILDPTDALMFQGNALCDLAEVLEKAGRSEEAVAALQGALERYERKRNLPMAAQVRRKLGLAEDPAEAM